MPKTATVWTPASSGSSSRPPPPTGKPPTRRCSRTMLAQLHLIRAFEETVLELAAEGLVHGPAHSSIGQEGGAVGSIVGLRSHRRGQRLAPRPPPVPRQGAHARVAAARSTRPHLVTPEIQTVLQRTLAEILGLAQGYCRGRGGSMHLQWFEAGALGTNAIVGGGAPMATGNAWAQKHAGTTDITINYFGDGASQIGSILESMNLAADLEAAGLLLHREQPLRRVDPRRRDQRRPALLDPRAGLRHPSWRVDGMDPLAVHLAMKAGRGADARRRRSRRRRGRGLPLLPPERPVPGQRLRLPHQGGGGGVARARPARSDGARDDEARPDRRGGRRRGARAGAGGDDGSGGRAARSRPDNAGKRRIRPELWPDPGFVNVGVRGDASELDGLTRRRPARPLRRLGRHQVRGCRGGRHGPPHGAGPAHRGPRRGRAPPRRRHERRHQGPGQEVRRPDLGDRPRARHADQRERVLRAGRRARARRPLPPGRRVHVPDFMWVAADQVFNQIGKARHMFGGDNPVPLVLRTKVAMGSRLRLAAPDGSRGHLRDEPRAGASSRRRPRPTTSGS